MKTIISISFFSLLLCLIITSCSKVSEVKIDSVNSGVIKGRSIQLRAIAKGEGEPDSTVSWTIIDQVAEGTSISQNGLLTISENESLASLEVRAISIFDTSKVALLKIKILPFGEVTIGNQVWMTENLNVDTFRNGDIIPEAKTDEDWSTALKNKRPAFCYYENIPANGVKFGKLYNFHSLIDSRGLAPVGYHIPTNDEWTTLRVYLGGESAGAGKKMKSKEGWKDNRNGTNESGFSGLPGGSRFWLGKSWGGGFMNVNTNGQWWGLSNTKEAYCIYLSYDRDDMEVSQNKNYNEYTNDGYSLRCIKD